MRAAYPGRARDAGRQLGAFHGGPAPATASRSGRDTAKPRLVRSSSTAVTMNVPSPRTGPGGGLPPASHGLQPHGDGACGAAHAAQEAARGDGRPEREVGDQRERSGGAHHSDQRRLGDRLPDERRGDERDPADRVGPQHEPAQAAMHQPGRSQGADQRADTVGRQGDPDDIRRLSAVDREHVDRRCGKRRGDDAHCRPERHGCPQHRFEEQVADTLADVLHQARRSLAPLGPERATNEHQADRGDGTTRHR